jgi:hypothetical protein
MRWNWPRTGGDADAGPGDLDVRLPPDLGRPAAGDPPASADAEESRGSGALRDAPPWRHAIAEPSRFVGLVWVAAWPLLRSRTMLATLGSLLVVDAVLLYLHVVGEMTRFGWIDSAFADHAFSLEVEGGYAESFEYAKLAACAVALAGCWSRSRQPIYAALAVVFGIALVDNALGLHERFGHLASGALQPTEALFAGAPVALGELGFFAIEGAVVLTLLLLGLRRSTGRHRLLGIAFLLLLLALGGFGVGVDLLHAIVAQMRYALDRIFTVIEDGGELVLLSVTCALALATFAHVRGAPER